MYTIKFLDGSIKKFETLRGANLEEAELSGTTFLKTNFEAANLKRARFEGSNFFEVNLKEANLKGANLEGANLYEANLKKANLEGAYCYGTNVLIFSFGKHFGFAHFGNQYENGSLIEIGCISNSLDWWLENYKKVGKKNNYTDKEIELYGNYLHFLQTNRSIICA